MPRYFFHLNRNDEARPSVKRFAAVGSGDPGFIKRMEWLGMTSIRE
jgi:hypothetical protein